MKKANAQHIKGWLAEKVARIFLCLKGYKIIAQNHKRWVEVDILASKESILVAVEVKYRRTRQQAITALGMRQKQRLLQQALHLSVEYKMQGARVEAVFIFMEWPFLIHVEHVEK